MAKHKTLQAIVEIAGTLSPTLGKSVDGVVKKLDKVNLKAAALTGGVTLATAKATKALINFGKEAVEAASSYETAFAGASTLMQGTDKEIQAISDSIIKASNNTGIAAEDMANSVYSAISAGIDQDDAVEFAEKAAKLASAGFTDVDTALSATAKTLNAYGMEADKADEIQKILIQTQNKGITTVGELGASLSQVTPTAASFGVSFDQVGASLAVMTAQGTTTATATTQLNSLIAELGKSGTTAATNLSKAAKGTKYAGMSFSEMMDSGADLSDVLGMLEDSADQSGLSMVDMFSSIEAGKAALSIASSDGKTFKNDLAAMATEEDVVGEAYEKTTGTYEHQIEVLQNLGQNAKISFGERLLPIITKVAQKAVPLLTDAIDELLPVFDAVGDGLSPIVDDLLPQIAPLASDIIDPLVDMAGALASQLAPVVSGVVEPVTGMAGTLASQIIPLITDITTSLIPMLASVLIAIMPTIQTLIGEILPLLVDIIDMIVPIVTTLISSLMPIVQNVLEALIPVITAILAVVEPVLDAIGQLVDEIMPVLQQLLEDISPILEEAANIVAGALIDRIESITSIIMPIINNVLPVIIQLMETLMPPIMQIVGTWLPLVMQLLSVIGPILTFILQALTPILDTISVLINAILPPAMAIISGIMPVISVLAQFISGILCGAIQLLTSGIQGVISIVSTIASVFAAAFEAAVGVVKGPINTIIGMVNGVISSINGIGFTIPDWVPVVGGKSFSLDFPQIPYMASGGFTDGMSIAGEAGTEAVISFDNAYRAANIGYWAQAGEMLGLYTDSSSMSASALAGDLLALDDFSLADLASEGTTVIYDFSGMSYNPVINTTESDSDIMAQLREAGQDFFDWLEAWIRRKEQTAYG